MKTSLAPGSGVVTKYLLERYIAIGRIVQHRITMHIGRILLTNFDDYSGLQEYLNKQGFHLVGYGCTTCIGNSGDLDESVSSAIVENGTVKCQHGLFIWLQ